MTPSRLITIYANVAQSISEEVRDRVLKHVMIRCTRSEIEQYYAEDVEKQGLPPGGHSLRVPTGEVTLLGS